MDRLEELIEMAKEVLELIEIEVISRKESK